MKNRINRFANFMISCLYFVGKKTLVCLQSFKHNEMPGTCVCIVYHKVTKENIGKFARQMDSLKKLALIWPATIEKQPDSKTHVVILTFDDGFVDIVENALPELIKRNIPAMLFIPTGYLGKYPRWEIDAGYETEVDLIVTSEHLKRLPGDLISIGSHTVTHPRLTSCSPEIVLKELRDSRATLETILGKEVKCVSIPFGDYNKNIVDMALQVGYTRIFNSDPSFAFTSPEEVTVGRISITPDDNEWVFRLKVFGAYSWKNTVRDLKRRWNNKL